MQFKIRTTKPEAGNKNFIRRANGGWNTCIVGSPTDKDCNVLSNCVGYASGRFNEIYNEITGHTGSHKWDILNCNAENFIERAVQLGLEISNVPTLGGIMVWAKGKPGVSSDGVGHVGIVEKIIDDNTIYTSESAYGGSAFYNSTRKNTNGRWGMGSTYSFRACIINPAVKNVKVASNVKRNETKDQVEVLITDLNVRMEPSTKGSRIGYAKKGYYNVLNKTTANGYTWLKIAEDQYIAYDKEWETLLPKKEEEVKPTPAPTPTPDPVVEPIIPLPAKKLKYKVGDKVVVSGFLYRTANADFSVRTVLGKVTKITRTFPTGKHPYNTTGDLGWMDEKSIKLYDEVVSIKKGDKVKVIEAVTYEGKKFFAWYSKYDVIEVSGDRVVIGIGKLVTAAVNIKNLQKV